MHVPRHTYVIRTIESGIPPKVLQEHLGHASIKTGFHNCYGLKILCHTFHFLSTAYPPALIVLQKHLLILSASDTIKYIRA